MYNYIHIPFCRQKCKYCKFALTPRWQRIQLDRYLGALESEIREFFAWRKENLESIYFGGGTPSVLEISDISRILSVFRESGMFSENIEIILEANPEDISFEYVEGLKNIWVNRLSLGIQTLNEKSLSEIGRKPQNTIYCALESLETSGFQNVNMDFIIGLPYVKKWETIENIQELLGKYSCIKHVSIYMLEEDRYPVNWKKVSLSKNDFEEEFLAIREFLWKQGFIHYELSNFARPWFESEHNQSYWNHKNYRGFGLAAASFLDGKRFTQSTSFDGYYTGKIIDEELLTNEQMQLEEIMFRFRTFRGVPVSWLQNKQKLEEFLTAGHVRRIDKEIFLNPTWIFILDYIMAELI